MFPVEGQATTETAIRTTASSDLYVALGDERGPALDHPRLCQSAGAVHLVRRRDHGAGRRLLALRARLSRPARAAARGRAGGMRA